LNLQGIWNADFIPMWDSKYTVNINTEMNYWPAEQNGLGECVEPVQRMLEELAQTGAGVARDDVAEVLDEVPEELVKWLTPRAGKGGFAAPSAPTSFNGVPRRSESSRGGSGFRIGQNVMHAKFGLGVIVNAEGSGTDARVQVNFGAPGMKWLALSVAKLEAA